jgi:hypothetical protein
MPKRKTEIYLEISVFGNYIASIKATTLNMLLILKQMIYQKE